MNSAVLETIHQANLAVWREISYFVLVAIVLFFAILFVYLHLKADFQRKMKDELQKSERKEDLFNFFQRYVDQDSLNKIITNHREYSLDLGGRRKKVTIIFSDIRNFTGFSERMKPEEVIHILNEFLTGMVEIIFKYDGTLDKFTGDGLMAFFGAPIYHEDDAKRAVIAAIEMQKELESYQKKWEMEGRIPLKVRIGINTGYVVVGNIGSPQRKDYTVVGDEVNLTKRLQETAEAGQILITQETYDEIKDTLEAKKLGTRTFKGKSETVTVYEVLGVRKEKREAL